MNLKRGCKHLYFTWEKKKGAAIWKCSGCMRSRGMKLYVCEENPFSLWLLNQVFVLSITFYWLFFLNTNIQQNKKKIIVVSLRKAWEHASMPFIEKTVLREFLNIPHNVFSTMTFAGLLDSPSCWLFWCSSGFIFISPTLCSPLRHLV